MNHGVQSWLGDTLALYGRVIRRAAVLTRANPLLAAVAIAYPLIAGAALVMAAPLGMFAGFAVFLVTVMLWSSWLTLTGHVIRSGRVMWGEIRMSLFAHMADVATAWFLVTVLVFLASHAQPPLNIIFVLAVVVFFNAIPELIYLGNLSGFELLAASYRFIGESWIEWFPPNVVLAGLLLAPALLPPGPFGIVQSVLIGITAAFGMLVRGLLFIELTQSSRRGRAFKRAAGG